MAGQQDAAGEPWPACRPATSVFALLQDCLGRDPDRTALIHLASGEPDDAMRVSRGEFLARIIQAANLFHQLGVGRQSSVAYLLPLGLEAHFTLWGAMAAGVAAPINPALRGAEIAELAGAARAKVLVVDTSPEHGIWPRIAELRARLPHVTILTVGPAVAGAADLMAELDRQPGAALAFRRDIGPGDVAAYVHTGGTTGSPRLACITHDNLVFGAWAQNRHFSFGDEDVVLNALPLFHIGGIGALSLNPLSAGAALVLLTPVGFRNPAVVRNFWRIVARHRGTYTGIVPTMAQALLGVPVGDADIASLSLTMLGGATVQAALASEVERHFGTKVVATFGQTECQVIAASPRAEPHRAGSSGKLLPHMQVQVRELLADGGLGGALPPGLSGMILAKGPAVFAGYTDPAKTEAAFTADGWLVTGDLGHLDEDDWLYVTGRAKDVIVRGGHKIDPLMIEAACAAHPDIAACAAIGEPDRYAGELPVVYLTLREGAAATQEDIAAWCADRVAEPAAQPKRIYLLDALPMTAVGKISKPALRADAVRRVAERELGGLDGIAAIAVRDDRARGFVVEVTGRAEPGRRDPLAAEIAARLGFYVFAHEIGWAS